MSQSNITPKQESLPSFNITNDLRRQCPNCFNKLITIQLEDSVQVFCNEVHCKDLTCATGAKAPTFDLAVQLLNKQYEREHNINQSHHEPASDQ